MVTGMTRMTREAGITKVTGMAGITGMTRVTKSGLLQQPTRRKLIRFNTVNS